MRPPSHAGIVPSALPALSAPMGVSSLPSLAISSGDSPAHTVAVIPTANTSAQPRMSVEFLRIVVPPFA